MTKRGWFITFEGIEGCGKSTQLARLQAWFRERDLAVRTTKEPGGTMIGQAIRAILLNATNTAMSPTCEALLYLADRAQHHAEVVAPALAAGTAVLSDRYHDSTRAYQAAARGLDRRELDRVFAMAANGLEPDLTLLLDLDAQTGLQRARQRNADTAMDQREGRFEAEHLAFHQAVREAFLEMAVAEPDRFQIIDASGDPATVAAAVINTVRHHFKELHHV